MKKSATLRFDSLTKKKVIVIEFTYNYKTLEFVRSLPSRIYYKELDCWTTPVYIDTVRALEKEGFTLDEKLSSLLTHTNSQIQQYSQQGIKGLKGSLIPFQYEGVVFVENNNGRALIADEMGLGKTIEALAWLQLHRDRAPVLIVCPAFLKSNWSKEANKWLPDPNVEILNGRKPWQPTGNILIINYEILHAWEKTLINLNIRILITDESHYYKSNSAERTRSIKKLAKRIPHILVLTGTPVENSPIEIYNAVHILAPDLFPNFRYFTTQYCGAKFSGHGWDYSGATNMKELHKILTTSIMIRRKKVDVLPQLPSKTKSVISVPINNRSDYRRAEHDFINWVKEEYGEEEADIKSNAIALSKISELKKLSVTGKLDSTTEWIKDFLESGKKLVVFCYHTFVIDYLMETFHDISVRVDGGVSNPNREKAQDAFQNNPKIKLFICQIKAGGVGLTLTAASDTLTLELVWNPKQHEQADDRVHRIGQKEAVVNYYLLAENTIEEKIANLLDIKSKIVDSITDGEEPPRETLLYQLLQEYKLNK